MKNEAMYLVGVERFELREEPMPVCGDEEVVVRTGHVGICGSDVHFFADHENELKNGVYELPLLLGHECAGEVYQVGKNVQGLQPGDRVAVEPGIPCGVCEYCKSGRYNLCPSMIFMAAPPQFNGALRRYFNFPAHMVFKLPDNVGTLEGALIEPLAVGMHATKRAGIGLGDTAVIIGSGCIGLTVLLSCLARGASRVVVVDVFDNRLEKAKELGAFATVNASKQDAAGRVQELLGGRLPDFVFEAAGKAATVELAARMVNRGGSLVLVGSVNEESRLKFYELTEKEANIIMTFRYCNMYPKAIEAIASGSIDVKSIASNVFAFSQTQLAFEQAEHNKQAVVKGVIQF